jgi:hypothetical protein
MISPTHGMVPIRAVPRAFYRNVSQVRSKACANETAEVRRLVFVKKKTQTSSITPEAATPKINQT